MSNLFNWFATEKTNEANLQAVRETNQSNVEQANLAFQHSLPTNQVRNLMAAGMSRQGALSSLTGGGTYTAPVLQSGHSDAPQVDFSQFASAMDRLSDTPTNVEQYKLIQEQRHALEVDTQNKINADRRQQEAHTYAMWQQQHGKEYASALDEASKTLVNSMLDAGTSYSDYKDAHDAVRKLGLSNKPLFRNMPALAWSDLETAVRDANTERRANVAAKDAHTAALDALRNSEAERVLNHYQVNKLIADTESAWQNVQAFDEATEVRQKENAAKAAQADFLRIMSNFGISEHELKNANFWTKDADGNYIPRGIGNTKSGIYNAWQFVGTFFGVDLLADIVRGIVAISPK